MRCSPMSRCSVSNSAAIVGSIPEFSGTVDSEGWQVNSFLNVLSKISYFTQDRKFETNTPRNETARAPNFYIHVHVSDLNIFTIDPPILLYTIVFAERYKSLIYT